MTFEKGRGLRTGGLPLVLPSILASLVSFGLVALPASASEPALPSPPSPLPLDWALERAAAMNPEIAGNAAARDAARERADSAWALEDPRFSYEASNIPVGDWDFNSTPLSGQQLGLRQHLPFPGVLGNREAAARAGYEASRMELDDRRRAVAGAVETAWAELGFVQRALAITRRNIELLRQLAAIAEARYKVGSGLQQDVIRAQVELTSFLEEELAREAAVVRAEARVAELLDLPAELPLPQTASLEDPTPVPPIGAVLEGLEQRSPLLLALAARVEEAEKQVRVARFEGLPDVDLGVGYRIRRNVPGDPVEGEDFFSAGFTVRLPVDRRRWNAKVAEARADVRHAQARYRGAAASLRARVRTAHAELTRADADSRLVATGLIPQARQSLESSRSAYEVGRIDFLALLDSQVGLLRAELREVRALADRRAAFASLEVAAGEDLR
jgi:cobalt-zinc-cadmium efflux system outer membrane protein